MLHPAQLAALARARLRYFRYWPPMGGFGGDWDTLTGTARFDDDAALARIMAALGRPAGERTTDIGMIDLAGMRVHVSVNGDDARVAADRRTITFTAAMYVTAEHIVQARAVEDWLDAHGVQMLPAGP